jgi:hypothetical protein
MKPREARQKVMIRARMLSGSVWHDICILNCSPHGLGIQAADPPFRGSYVEIRRGQQVIVARVAWRNGHRAGLRSRDSILASALISGGNAPEAPTSEPYVERRSQPRQSVKAQHSDSRLAGRAIEFASFGFIAAMLGVAALSIVSEAFARPMAAVSAVLR